VTRVIRSEAQQMEKTAKPNPQQIKNRRMKLRKKNQSRKIIIKKMRVKMKTKNKLESISKI